MNPVQECAHILNVLCILCAFLFCCLQTCPTGQFYLEFCGVPTPLKLFWVTNHFPRIDVYSDFFVKNRNNYAYSYLGCVFLKGWGVSVTLLKGGHLVSCWARLQKGSRGFEVLYSTGGGYRIPNTNSTIKNAVYTPNPTQLPPFIPVVYHFGGGANPFSILFIYVSAVPSVCEWRAWVPRPGVLLLDPIVVILRCFFLDFCFLSEIYNLT